MDDVLLRDLLAKYLRSIAYLGWTIEEGELLETIGWDVVSIPVLFVWPRDREIITVRYVWGVVTIEEASTDFFDVPMDAAPATITRSLRKCVAKFPAV